MCRMRGFVADSKYTFCKKKIPTTNKQKTTKYNKELPTKAPAACIEGNDRRTTKKMHSVTVENSLITESAENFLNFVNRSRARCRYIAVLRKTISQHQYR